MRRLSVPIVLGPLLSLACGATGAGPSGGPTGADRPLSSTARPGVATYYDANGAGNCSFPASPEDLDVTALAMPEYDGSSACGACIRVTGPKGEVTVRVVDSCPGCEDKGIDLDLGAQAFAKIAEPADGRVSITYQLVSCATSGNIAYHFKDGSSQYWTAIQIRNHRVPIAKVEYRRSGAWVAMRRESYNYFVEADGVGAGSVTLRVTAIDGQTIEDTLAGGVEAERTVVGGSQFD